MLRPGRAGAARRGAQRARSELGGRGMTERRTRRGALTGLAGGAGGATALTLLLAACAVPGGESGAGAQSKGPVKIGVVTRGGGDGTGMEQVIIPAFTKVYPNIQVEHASLGGEPDYWAK